MAAGLIRQAPLHILARTIVVLTIVGILIFVPVIAGFTSPFWSRPLLVLQGLALLFGVIVYYRQRVRRFLLYPLLLAAAIYLWDTTLPPPSLPDGLLRFLIPRVVMVGILGHLVYLVLQRRKRIRRIVPVVRGYVQLDEVAPLFDRSPAQLRTQVLLAGYRVYIDSDAKEYVALKDLMAVLADDPSAYDRMLDHGSDANGHRPPRS
jgi:hypothetical protein